MLLAMGVRDFLNYFFDEDRIGGRNVRYTRLVLPSPSHSRDIKSRDITYPIRYPFHFRRREVSTLEKREL